MEENEAVDAIEKGSMKLHEIEEVAGVSAAKAAAIRRAYLTKRFGKGLEHSGSATINFEDALNRNIENPIGATQVPLGYAGNLKVNGSYADGSYPVLLATTEGRLVAGVSRGISTLNIAGGVNTAVIGDGMTRDVLIRVANVRESDKLLKLIGGPECSAFLKEEFSKSGKHAQLIEVKPFTNGRDVHLRFKAKTGAAMGMNMVTIAARSAIEALIPYAKEKIGIGITLISESGNMCSDKKPALINVIEGRGVSVISDATLSGKIVRERFKAEPEAMAELSKAKNLVGSALAGSHGFNAHVANVLAAMYIAYGQDVAQIVEGSQAITDASVVDGNLYISCTLPAIEVGTYGGGTSRETQREALELSGLSGENDNEGRTRLAFAEIVAAACLAGEVNLLAVEASTNLASSHSSIKRG